MKYLIAKEGFDQSKPSFLTEQGPRRKRRWSRDLQNVVVFDNKQDAEQEAKRYRIGIVRVTSEEDAFKCVEQQEQQRMHEDSMNNCGFQDE